MSNESFQPPLNPAEVRDKLALPDALDKLCHEIASGRLLTEIGLEWGISMGRLRYWIGVDSARSARVREARSQAAMVYDEQAQKAIADAQNEFDLKKAKELAHHLRWKASKANPADFGEKLDVTATMDVRSATDAQLAKELAGMGLSAAAEALMARRDMEDGNVVRH